MRAVLLAMSFGFLPAALNAQAPIAGSMTCEVKSSYVVGIDDGQANEFLQVAGGFSAGSSLVFAYIADPDTQDLSLYLMESYDAAQPILAWSSNRSALPSAPLTDMGGYLLSTRIPQVTC